MSFVLLDSQKVGLSIDARSSAGNQATLDGVPVWSSSDPSIVTVEASEDGLSAVATAVGPVGTAQVQVVADADIGDGVRELTALLDIEVKGGEAVSLVVNAGAAEEK